MRERALLLVLVAAGCATLTNPEGDGGWSETRQREELTARATAAAVALDGDTPPVPASDKPLALPAALAAARENRRVAQAERDVEIAAARVRVARAGLLPRTTAEGQYTWYSDPLTTALEGGNLPGTFPVTPRIEIREQEVGTVATVAALPLDLSGELRHTLKAAQAGYRGEAARRWAVVLDEEAATTRAYFDLLETQELAKVTAQRLVAQRAQLANAEDYYRTGRLTKNELLVVQVAVRDTEQETALRALAVDEARWQLNQTIGLPVDAPTRVVPITTLPALPPVATLLTDTFATNPALTALVEEQQRLDAQATALARARLPRFSGGGRLDWNSQDILDPKRLEAGFVGFAWDLGTDGRREAELAAARLAADRQRLAIERELRQLERAVRRLHRAAEERLSALATAAAAVAQAEENLRIREQQFAVGRATSEDVLDAEALLARQRAGRARALYQAHVRRAELEQLTGRSLDRLYTDAR